MTAAPSLQLGPGDRNELEVSTALVRRFLDMGSDEWVELTAFVRNRPWVCHVQTEADHVEALREAQRISGYCGAYMLVNGPVERAVFYRYDAGRWQPATNGRVADSHIEMRRALFIDVDPERPKGISATDAEERASFEVAHEIRNYLESEIGRPAVGFGSSGNGRFILVALEPRPPHPDDTKRISRFLDLLNRRFARDGVKIDRSVFNAARLMPAPGTWKRKGIDSRERPHRLTSFCCTAGTERVPLEVLC